MKDPRYCTAYCRCCGHQARHRSQLKLYHFLVSVELEASSEPFEVPMVRHPQWKPALTPDWDKVYFNPDGTWRHRLQIKQDNCQRTTRLRAARTRKLWRQNGLIPYKM